jgi:hypothetical protein
MGPLQQRQTYQTPRKTLHRIAEWLLQSLRCQQAGRSPTTTSKKVQRSLLSWQRDAKETNKNPHHLTLCIGYRDGEAMISGGVEVHPAGVPGLRRGLFILPLGYS